VPAEAAVWLDARAPAPGDLAAWRTALAEAAAALEAATGVTITIGIEAQSDGVDFDAHVRDALGRAAAARFGSPAHAVVCYAGHDAGVIGERLPAGMVLVRNQTGISHAPEEHVELDDAAAAADVLVAALQELTRG
jgi:N-carbamoyl-L-amino-acid hydrolase